MDLPEEISLLLSKGLLCSISLLKEEISVEFAKGWVNTPKARGGSAGERAGMDSSGLEDSAVLFLLKLFM